MVLARGEARGWEGPCAPGLELAIPLAMRVRGVIGDPCRGARARPSCVVVVRRGRRDSGGGVRGPEADLVPNHRGASRGIRLARAVCGGSDLLLARQAVARDRSGCRVRAFLRLGPVVDLDSISFRLS
jgi:hypothetical protein